MNVQEIFKQLTCGATFKPEVKFKINRIYLIKTKKLIEIHFYDSENVRP